MTKVVGLFSEVKQRRGREREGQRKEMELMLERLLEREDGWMDGKGDSYRTTIVEMIREVAGQRIEN